MGKKSKGKKTSKRSNAKNAPASEQGIADNSPLVQQSNNHQLRFAVGDDVYCFCRDGTWQAGTVVETHYRSAKWPDSRQSCAYRVEQKSGIPVPSEKGPFLVEVESDTDDHVRLLISRYPRSALSKLSVHRPEPDDPLSHLYLKTGTEHCLDAFDSMKEQITSYRTYSYGLVALVTFLGVAAFFPGALVSFWGVAALAVSVAFFSASSNPETLVDGLGANFIYFYISPRIRLRRQWQEPVRSTKETFEALLPEKTSIRELERRIESSPPALLRDQLLLRLGDAYVFGLKGCSRDVFRASQYYKASGFGVPIKDVANIERDCHSAGLPEALCALAVQFHYQAELLANAWKLQLRDPLNQGGAGLHRPSLAVKDIFLASKHEPRVLNMLEQAIQLLAGALKYGWVSVLAIQYGEYIYKQGDWLIPRMVSQSNNIDRIRLAYWNQQATVAVQKEMKDQGYARPSESTLEKFETRSTYILQDLPFETSQVSKVGLHIRFVEIPTISRPVGVVLVSSDARAFDLNGSFLLPEALQFFPFSNEAFEWIWCRIAFTIHMGFNSAGVATKQRVMPSQFKFLDIPGDRDFAKFLRIKCSPINGTDVSIGFEEHHKQLEIDRQVKLRVRMHAEELEKVPITLSSAVFWRRVNEAGPSAFQAIQDLSSTSIPDDASKVLEDEANRLQNVGNAFYRQHDYFNAQNSYLKAMSKFRSGLAQPSPSVLQCMGLLLSNFAEIGLRLARSETPWLAAALLKEAIVSCDILLTSRQLSSAATVSHLTKVRFWRDLAESRLPRDMDLWLTEPEDILSYDGGVCIDLSFKMELFGGGQFSSGESGASVLSGMSMSERTDESRCPICLHKLAHKLIDQCIVHLQCDHFICAPCAMKTVESNKDYYSCPLCRKKFYEDLIGKVVKFVLSSNDAFRKTTDELPGKTQNEREYIVREVLKNKECDIEAAQKHVDDMLYTSFLGIMWQSEDLTHEQKTEIYEDARRPCKALRDELDLLQSQRDDIIDEDSEAYAKVSKEIQALNDALHDASMNAKEDIYFRMNSAGHMGVMNNEKDYQLDFHGLNVKEARERFDSMIMPVLPVLKKVVLITGRGRHSNTGVSAIKDALHKHVARNYAATVDLVKCKKNRGIIVVTHIDEKGE